MTGIQRIDLKVGFQCNNLCKFCVQGDKRERLPAKALDELLRSLSDGRASGADGVVFTGGEPTLHPGILALVRKAKALGYRNIQLQSNGRSFCYPGTVAKLMAAGANEFGPSLHGSRAEIHDFLTGAKGSFLQTVAGMKNVKKAGARLITNSVVTKCNYRDLPDLAKLLVSLGVDQYQFAFMHVTGRAAQNREWLTARKTIIEPWVKKGLDVGIKTGRIVMTEAIPYCFMSGYEDYVAEKVIPRTKIYDADAVIEDFTQTRRNEGKTKGPKCPECRWFSACEGPWREYPEMFGWDEFIPVAKPKRKGRALKLVLSALLPLAAGQCLAQRIEPASQDSTLLVVPSSRPEEDQVKVLPAKDTSASLPPLSEAAARDSRQRYMIGLMLFQKGNYAGAREEWNWSLFHDPMNEDAKAGLKRLAKLEHKPALPRPSLAVEVSSAPVAQSSEQDRRSSQQHYLSGVVFFQKGDYEKARNEWALALRLDPGNEDAMAGIKRVSELYGEKPQSGD
ncbi:MAG: radical SAM protein [Elusimicrobia bacterium]|nr:radical SAM protein [Elusimicrobiota bacterium]